MKNVILMVSSSGLLEQLHMVLTWFDRARRALQRCIFKKNFNRLFEMKTQKTMRKVMKIRKKASFLEIKEKILKLEIKSGFSIIFTVSDISKSSYLCSMNDSV